jgi:hypothetical protein
MKSFLSLLAALAVVGGLAAGGYWLYQNVQGGGTPGGSSGNSGNVMVATSTGVSLALTNGTHYALTVDMRQGAGLVHFQILPGHTETRSFPAGDYQVEGKISDPNTDPFSTQWSFQDGGQYNATFSRDSQGNTVGELLLVNGGGSQGQQGQQKKPPTRPRPRP